MAIYLVFDPRSPLNPGTIIAIALLTPQFMESLQGIADISINFNSN